MDYKWQNVASISKLFENYKIGQYKFKNIFEVSNIIVYFLDL